MTLANQAATPERLAAGKPGATLTGPIVVQKTARVQPPMPLNQY